MEIKRWLVALAWLLAAGGLQAQTFTEQDFSFNIVDVTTHDTMRIAGTLTLPYGVEGQVPAVILITGSGAQNRDEELMGHKPFKVIAEYLSTRGYAVLRCDDRGVGESTGDMVHATTLDSRVLRWLPLWRRDVPRWPGWRCWVAQVTTAKQYYFNKTRHYSACGVLQTALSKGGWRV